MCKTFVPLMVERPSRLSSSAMLEQIGEATTTMTKRTVNKRLHNLMILFWDKF
jgi:hypothetical protein